MPFCQSLNFTSTQRTFMLVQHSVLNLKAPVGAFNQDKALVGSFPVITLIFEKVRFQL